MASAEVKFKLIRQGSAAFWGQTPETQANYQEFIGLHTDYWADRFVVVINENEIQVNFTVFDDNPDEMQVWVTSGLTERFSELSIEFLNYCETNAILITCNYQPWEGVQLFNGATDFYNFL